MKFDLHIIKCRLPCIINAAHLLVTEAVYDDMMNGGMMDGDMMIDGLLSSAFSLSHGSFT